MSCSPFDLRDYIFKELTDPQQRQVEAHVKTCPPCREELERLQLTEAALCRLRDEEIPQRIAFVSDKIFEPSPMRRWLSGFWSSGARLGFASAAMLSAAILVSALTRPAPAPVVVAHAPAAVVAATVPDAQIEQRVQAAVQAAMAENEARHVQQTKQLVSELEQTRQHLLLAAQEFDLYQKRDKVRVMATSQYGPPVREDGDMK
jgi:anti-sigma factor RsiW